MLDIIGEAKWAPTACDLEEVQYYVLRNTDKRMTIVNYIKKVMNMTQPVSFTSFGSRFNGLTHLWTGRPDFSRRTGRRFHVRATSAFAQFVLLVWLAFSFNLSLICAPRDRFEEVDVGLTAQTFMLAAYNRV